MAMINKEILEQLTINETCYEDNFDDCGSPYWTPEEIADPDEFIEIASRFCLMTPPKKGLRRVIFRLDDHPILWGEVVSLINTIDLDELAAKVEEEIDLCLAWAETEEIKRRYRCGGL